MPGSTAQESRLWLISNLQRFRTSRARYTFGTLESGSPDGSKWVRHGLFVEYSECGSVVSEGHYLNRLEHGHWRDFYPSGQMAASGQYEHGAEVGPWHYWNERGEEEQGDVQPRRNAGA